MFAFFVCFLYTAPNISSIYAINAKNSYKKTNTYKTDLLKRFKTDIVVIVVKL